MTQSPPTHDPVSWQRICMAWTAASATSFVDNLEGISFRAVGVCLSVPKGLLLGTPLVSPGASGELRVGVRRAMRQLSNVPSSFICSQSMHLGVLATAWHAINTKSIFTAYYKPRTSPSKFIIPYDQYTESVKNNYSIGMRFRMRFEGEEAPEQRFTGTIVGSENLDPVWSESGWRSLKVQLGLIWILLRHNKIKITWSCKVKNR